MASSGSRSGAYRVIHTICILLLLERRGEGGQVYGSRGTAASRLLSNKQAVLGVGSEQLTWSQQVSGCSSKLNVRNSVLIRVTLLMAV